MKVVPCLQFSKIFSRNDGLDEGTLLVLGLLTVDNKRNIEYQQLVLYGYQTYFHVLNTSATLVYTSACPLRN